MLAGAGVMMADASLFNDDLERELTALAQIVADNSTGALAFDDAKAAAQTLGALRARTHMVAACIYRKDGSELARYLRPQSHASCPPPAPRDEVTFQSDSVLVTQRVMLSGDLIGALSLLYDLEEIGERRTIYGSTVLSIVLLAFLLAALLSARFSNLIAGPVAKLVDTVTTVSVSRNYGLRAEKITNDEMGVLVDEFNEMLSRIEARDAELRTALAEREEANRDLAASNADLERFAFVASHDLQEPLRMMTVYTQLLQKRGMIASSPDSQQFVEQIVTGARRMHELLDDLRAYAELRAEADLVAVDLNAAVNRAIENLKLPIASSGARILVDPLPLVRAYLGHFVAMFQNLIGNAIKYRGSEPPLIRITCERTAGMLRFAVSDNGIGIAQEYQKSIFVPFKRLHGQDIPGSGIGLAICQRVAERYGGRIWVESELNKGSTFIFTMPEAVLAEASERGPSRE
jgi:signal transduction histidine kinase